MRATYTGEFGVRYELYEERGLLIAVVPGNYIMDEDTSNAVAVSTEVVRVKVRKLVVQVLTGDFIIKVWPAAQRFQTYKKMGVPESLRVAWLVREKTADHWFYETTVRKNGWDFRVYDNRHSALDWLESLRPIISLDPREDWPLT